MIKMNTEDLNLKEDSGFGLIRNHTIKHNLSRIKDETIREQYLKSLQSEDETKFKELQDYLESSEIID